MSPEEKCCKGNSCACYYVKTGFIIFGLCCIALGGIFLAEYFYKPVYNIIHLWPVFPIIVGFGVTIAVVFSRSKKDKK